MAATLCSLPCKWHGFASFVSRPRLLASRWAAHMCIQMPCLSLNNLTLIWYWALCACDWLRCTCHFVSINAMMAEARTSWSQIVTLSLEKASRWNELMSSSMGQGTSKVSCPFLFEVWSKFGKSKSLNSNSLQSNFRSDAIIEMPTICESKVWILNQVSYMNLTGTRWWPRALWSPCHQERQIQVPKSRQTNTQSISAVLFRIAKHRKGCTPHMTDQPPGGAMNLRLEDQHDNDITSVVWFATNVTKWLVSWVFDRASA